jgi:hypothetical protein
MGNKNNKDFTNYLDKVFVKNLIIFINYILPELIFNGGLAITV